MTTNGFMAQHFFRHGSAFPWSTWNTHRFLLNLKSFKYISPLSFANLDASFLREGTSGNIFKIPSKNSTKNSPFKKWISSSFFHHLLITQMEVTKNPWTLKRSLNTPPKGSLGRTWFVVLISISLILFLSLGLPFGFKRKNMVRFFRTFWHHRKRDNMKFKMWGLTKCNVFWIIPDVYWMDVWLYDSLFAWQNWIVYPFP